MSLKGKTAVVTGGASGIGFATARNYLKEGVVNLALLDIADNQQIVRQLTDEFSQADIVLLPVDIAKKNDVEDVFKTILKRFQRIDIVVNAAGVWCEQDLERTMNVNLIGLINTSMVALNAMTKSNGGRGGIIVNISSTAGLVAIAGLPFYSASKHGVVGFTRTMGNDVFYAKHGVKFTTVCPGYTVTPMVENALWDIEPEFAENIQSMLSIAPSQTADECGKAISLVTATSSNGVVWIAEGGKATEVTIPELWSPGQ